MPVVQGMDDQQKTHRLAAAVGGFFAVCVDYWYSCGSVEVSPSIVSGAVIS